ncbi:MAG: phosphotransferase [Oscillospiraceae bacterium]|nr:phosphotransferase [Oscillospiraceae bacterium]
MERDVCKIIAALGYPCPDAVITRFHGEEDDSPYHVWKVETCRQTFVLKKITPRERSVYETFFPNGGAVPKVYAFGEYQGDTYMLMEYVAGETLSRCTRQKLIFALDALVDTQERFWGNTDQSEVGCSFDSRFPALEKRLPYMEDLAEPYKAFLAEYSQVPRTLCNDDLLPFNVLAGETKAVILDWEEGGILPYPSAIARFLAFGEETEDALFYMTEEDRAFAVRYYYDKLIQSKGISWEDYLHSLRLFFFKEYSEWVYLARQSGDLTGEYCQKYYAVAKRLAKELGY